MAIVLDNVTKYYGRQMAVDALTLHVQQGEIFAFLGPNGAGKTTTIKMIAGLLQPNSGNVTVCGLRTDQNGQQAKAQLAYVPDQPFLYEKLSGREFLYFVGEMYGLARPQTDARIATLADQFDMNDFLDQLTESYSHGMKQRTVISAALLHDPRILLIDEPMIGLDPKTVRIAKDIMLDIARSGRTVFMSTHTLEVAQAVADRIGIIHHGRLIAVGTLDELRHQSAEQSSLEDIFLKLTAERDDPQAETVPA